MMQDEIETWILIIDRALKAHDIAEAEAKFCYEAAVEIERREIELSKGLDAHFEFRGGCFNGEYDA